VILTQNPLSVFTTTLYITGDEDAEVINKLDEGTMKMTTYMNNGVERAEDSGFHVHCVP